MANLTGRMLGPYSILRELDHGGMACAHLARQPSGDRQIAIKVPHPAHFIQDRIFLERFTREAKIVAGLQYPSILMAHDLGAHNGIREMPQPISPDRATKLVDQFAGALDCFR